MEQNPVAKVVKNSAGQISMQTDSGDYFDMSKHVGDKFYTESQLKAEIDRAIKECAAICEPYKNSEYFEMAEDIQSDIVRFFDNRVYRIK
jgi:hypothetical protein